MDQFVEGKNPYTILGLDKGAQSTLDEIKKVGHIVLRRMHDIYSTWGSPAHAAAVLCCCCMLQAYRRLALIKHPDKAKNKETAGG